MSKPSIIPNLYNNFTTFSVVLSKIPKSFKSISLPISIYIYFNILSNKF